MSIDLKSYQEKAVNELIANTVKLLGYDGPGEVCVFQAPTGSGKTVMMAKFIEGIIAEQSCNIIALSKLDAEMPHKFV